MKSKMTCALAIVLAVASTSLNAAPAKEKEAAPAAEPEAEGPTPAQLKARKALPIYKFIRELIQLRNENPILRDGKTEITRNGDSFSVVRTLGHKKMTLAVSLAGNKPSFRIQ